MSFLKSALPDILAFLRDHVAANVATIVTCCLTFLFGLKIVKYHAKQEAGRALRQSFDGVQETLNLSTRRVTDFSWSQARVEQDALDVAFPKQDVAVKEFSRYLHGSQRTKFLDAWDKYHRFHTMKRWSLQYIRGFSHCSDPLGLFNERVKEILAFT